MDRVTRDLKMNRVYRTDKGTELPILNLRGRDYLEVKYRLVWFREDHPDWAIETEILSASDQSAYARATIKDEHGRIIATSHKFETKQGFPDFIEKAETGAIGRALALIGYGTQFCADELDEGTRIVDSPIDYMPAKRGPAQLSVPKGEPISAADRTPDQKRPVGAKAKPEPATSGQTAVTTAEQTKRGEGAGAETRGGAGARVRAGGRPGAPPVEGPVGAEAAETLVSAADRADADQQEQLMSQGRLEPGDYRISFGKKYRGKRLRDIPRQELESYINWLDSSADKRGVPLSDEARFLKLAAGRYLMESTKH